MTARARCATVVLAGACGLVARSSVHKNAARSGGAIAYSTEWRVNAPGDLFPMQTLSPSPETWRAVMRLGDVGVDVSAWRLALVFDGFDLTGPGDPRAFTTSVHNATVSWQRTRGLKADGVVGAKTRAAIGADLKMPALVERFDPDAIPFVEARHWSRDVPAVKKNLIVLHCMEHAETSTSAEWCAAFFAGPDSPKASAHFCVDADSIVCCVPADRVAWHAPGANRYGIGIEHAGYARYSRQQWLDDASISMLMLSAKLTAHLCRRFGIPVTFVAGDLLRRGAAGITTHAEVSVTFEQSTHWDPGPHFPVNDYLAWVNEAMPTPPSKRV